MCLRVRTYVLTQALATYPVVHGGTSVIRTPRNKDTSLMRTLSEVLKWYLCTKLRTSEMRTPLQSDHF